MKNLLADKLLNSKKVLHHHHHQQMQITTVFKEKRKLMSCLVNTQTFLHPSIWAISETPYVCCVPLMALPPLSFQEKTLVGSPARHCSCSNFNSLISIWFQWSYLPGRQCSITKSHLLTWWFRSTDLWSGSI